MASTLLAGCLRRPLVALAAPTSFPTVALAAPTSFPTRAHKSLKGKSNASARWVRRQWNDPLVKQAKREGFRSRAAYKLKELNDKFQLIRKGDVVLDLGAAPGGWSQVAVAATKSTTANVRVVAVDLLRFDTIDGVAVVVGDFRQPDVRAQIDGHLTRSQGMADVVLSDMAPSFSGNPFSDAQQQLRLCYNALKMAELYLKPGGHFATKILKGEDAEEFRRELKAKFELVKGVKPQASRPESIELFLVAKGYKPAPPDQDDSSDATTVE
jgi:23S rRNA (uridine2552-2'-O)-methyltransferase